MKAFLKIEINRVLRSWSFWISLLIGLAITVSQYFMAVIPVTQYMDAYKTAGLGTIMPHSVFSKWIGGEAVSVQHFLYFMILPLLCIIPWSLSSFSDRKSGYIKNLFVRAPKHHYYIPKFITNFFVGGLLAVIPLIFNLLLCSATLPSLLPEVSTGTFAIRTTSLWAQLFFSKPYTYILLYLCVIFVFCGAIALFASAIGLILDNGFSIILLPFVSHLFMYTVFSSLDMQKYAPFYFLDPFQNAPDVSLLIIAFELIILITISVISIVVGAKNECL